MKFIISCEHGSYALPEAYQPLFEAQTELLTKPAAYDEGALEIAQYMAELLQAECFTAEYSRLLVDLNRSEGRRGFFSPITQKLSEHEKEHIIEQYYVPYRNKIFHAIENHLEHGDGPVIHLSIHSFTPYMRTREITNHFALLYDPNRKPEFKLCKRIKKTIRKTNKKIKMRMNFPYQGTNDALTTYLRSEFDQSEYIGIEVELNQKYFSNFQMYANILLHALKHSVHKVDKHSELKISHENVEWI